MEMLLAAAFGFGLPALLVGVFYLVACFAT